MPSILTGGLLVVVVALLVPAPVVLWMFHGALREALELPEWLRRSPEVAKGHASELADLVAESRRTGPTEGRRGFVARHRPGRAAAARDPRDLPGYGSLLRLVSSRSSSPVAIAVFAAIFEVGLAFAIVALDVVVRLVT